MTDIFILSAARTAIGTFGGSLSGMGPIDIATQAAKAAIARAGIDPAQIGQTVFGQCRDATDSLIDVIGHQNRQYTDLR